MQDRNKHIRIDTLVSDIVDRLHARHLSKATGHSRTLKVIRTFQEPASNPPKRDDRLTDTPSGTVKIRMTGSVR